MRNLMLLTIIASACGNDRGVQDLLETEVAPDATVGSPEEQPLTPYVCRPPRRYTFELPAAVGLPCGAANAATVLQFPVPDRGRAIAYFRGIIGNNGDAYAVTHFWNLRVVVGKASYQYGLGDDYCRELGNTPRANLGMGELGETDNTVTVRGHAGSTICTSGFLEVKPGSKLDVWVEDDHPDCAGEWLGLASYYQSLGADNQRFFDWSATMQPLVSLDFDAGEGSDLRLLSSVEGTPHTFSSRCGSSVGSLTTEISRPGRDFVTTREIVPGSAPGGMTHRVLSSNTLVRGLSGMQKLTLAVGKNIPDRVTTGGCCGDGVLAVIREK